MSKRRSGDAKERLGVCVAAALYAAALSCGGNPNQASSWPSRPSCLGRAVFSDPAESPYVLPFPVGAAYEVLQSYCSTGSHRDRFPYDFLMGFGDSVVAAHGGLVHTVVEQWTDDDKERSHNNYIWVLQDDGTVALYAHFQHQGVLVEVGDRVTTGDLLGTIGESGTPTPCPFRQCGILHFGVYAAWPPTEANEVPINFRNAAGPHDARGGLMAGAVYTALSW